jgi:hypothetical protein
MAIASCVSKGAHNAQRECGDGIIVSTLPVGVNVKGVAGTDRVELRAAIRLGDGRERPRAPGPSVFGGGRDPRAARGRPRRRLDPTQISQETASANSIAVDDHGDVWLGTPKPMKDARDLYFEWTRIRSEFDERGRR